MNAELTRAVGEVMARLPDTGYDGGVNPGRTRSRGYVVTTTGAAIRENAERFTLLRALGGDLGNYVLYTTKSGRQRVTTRKQADRWGGRYEEL